MTTTNSMAAVFYIMYYWLVTYRTKHHVQNGKRILSLNI